MRLVLSDMIGHDRWDTHPLFGLCPKHHIERNVILSLAMFHPQTGLGFGAGMFHQGYDMEATQQNVKTGKLAAGGNLLG